VQISEGRERRPPTTVGVRVAHNPRVWQTDGRTYRQNYMYDSQDRPRICSRGRVLNRSVTDPAHLVPREPEAEY